MSAVEIQIAGKTLPRPLRVHYCNGFACRFWGLMFRRSLDLEAGLLLVQQRDSRLDSAIHMFFVFTDLAVVWVNNELLVVDKILAKGWRPIYFPRAPARFVLECNPGRLGDFSIGDHLIITHA